MAGIEFQHGNGHSGQQQYSEDMQETKQNFVNTNMDEKFYSIFFFLFLFQYCTKFLLGQFRTVFSELRLIRSSQIEFNKDMLMFQTYMAGFSEKITEVVNTTNKNTNLLQTLAYKQIDLEAKKNVYGLRRSKLIIQKMKKKQPNCFGHFRKPRGRYQPIQHVPCGPGQHMQQAQHLATNQYPTQNTTPSNSNNMVHKHEQNTCTTSSNQYQRYDLPKSRTDVTSNIQQNQPSSTQELQRPCSTPDISERFMDDQGLLQWQSLSRGDNYHAHDTHTSQNQHAHDIHYSQELQRWHSFPLQWDSEQVENLDNNTQQFFDDMAVREGEITNSRAQSQGKSSEFKKPFNDCLSQSANDNLNTHMMSVGALISDFNTVGTVFVVGKKYVLTAWHVVRHIIQDGTMDQAFVRFNENPNKPAKHQFYVEREPAFVDVILDVAVLEIKQPINLPKSVLLCKNDTFVPVISVCGYGNPESPLKYIEHSCRIILPTSSELTEAIAHLDKKKKGKSQKKMCDYYKDKLPGKKNVSNLVDLGYRGYDDETKLLFHSYMEHGASGSPILTPHLKKGAVFAVGVMTKGIPDFFFELPKMIQSQFPVKYRFESGAKTSAIYKSMCLENESLAQELFGS